MITLKEHVVLTNTDIKVKAPIVIACRFYMDCKRAVAGITVGVLAVVAL